MSRRAMRDAADKRDADAGAACVSCNCKEEREGRCHNPIFVTVAIGGISLLP